MSAAIPGGLCGKNGAWCLLRSRIRAAYPGPFPIPRRVPMRIIHLKWLLRALVLALIASPYANAACCYFSAKNMDILQPAQKVFITWDPSEKVETFTVQRKV